VAFRGRMLSWDSGMRCRGAEEMVRNGRLVKGGEVRVLYSAGTFSASPPPALRRRPPLSAAVHTCPCYNSTTVFHAIRGKTMLELLTNAEKKADEARRLPSFKGLSLIDVRSKIAQMLGLIGRVEGVFTTYTVHDISHIDAMLKMLDWLIPPSTAKALTHADWLMIVLSIYLHDLGMLVTAEEFEARNENNSFTTWLKELGENSDGRDYLARTESMNQRERDVFFFQEYVRLGHASRIREWINGRHSRRWGGQVMAISSAIAELLRPLPSRFRDYLGAICESHHGNNLHRTDLFPLSAAFGNEQQELVNVQYAAILLRTADLLHVTKDRTPSVAYKILRLSDLKAVDEWDKQSGVFVVRPKGREFIEGHPESAVIAILADFTAERPLFALQEYLTYANEQIRQSKHWIDRSQEEPDAKMYSFPWHTVWGDVRIEGVPPHPLRFELDRGRLLDLLVGHTIYNDPTVAIRELLQNAIDAVRYQFYLDSRKASGFQPTMGRVLVLWDEEQRLLVVQDDGIGMDKESIQLHLMKVGSSYYATAQFESENNDFTPISRFGIGILTCFMISDDIEIITSRSRVGYRVRMTSVHSDYLLRELEEGDPLLEGLHLHGTKVKLRLRASIDLSKTNILNIMRYWVILPECPVLFQSANMEPISVGLDSVSAAAYSFLPERFQAESTEIIVKNKRDGTPGSGKQALYELAFPVGKSITGERGFISNYGERSEWPSVCVEGIRVAQVLPGFSDRIKGILSVRGDRSFRTTVSRAGLEKDEEYSRIANICGAMFLEHVYDEVKRIAEQEGQPMSRASVAAKWLSDDLFSACEVEQVEDQIEEEFRCIPSIVMEHLIGSSDRRHSVRTMVSAQELDRQSFWTVESRLVDSLSLISRDLGKELSIHEFLAALAPEFTQLRYSPLIPDAHMFALTIRKNHDVERVEFDESFQQSAIKWRPCSEGSKRSDMSLTRLDLGEDIARKMSAQTSYSSYLYGPRRSSLWVDFAPLVGKDSEVQIVLSRLGCVLKSDSPAARLWVSVISALVDLAKSEAIEELIALWRVAELIIERNTDYERWTQSMSPYGSRWRERGIDLPEDLSSFLKKYRRFDASSYWRDWSRGSELNE